MHLVVVSPFPPELTGVGQYGWNVVHGLAATRRFSAITVLAQRPGKTDVLPRNGHSPELLAPAPSAPIDVRRAWSRDDPLAAARLARHIRAARPDAVWFNVGFTVFGASRPVNFLGLMAPLLVRQPGVRLVVTLHQLLEATLPNTIGAKNGHVTALGVRTATRLLLNADAVCVTLRRYRDVLQTHYGARNVRHIPHGAYAALENLPRPSGGPPEDILFFGSAAPFKGLATLLQAFDLLKTSRPQATLTIAGADHPRFPGYLTDLRSQAEDQPGGASGIRWLGAQTEAEVRDLFAQSSVAVLPYTATTGTSSVLHRAVACGRPVVASDLPDLRTAEEEEGLRLDFVPPSDAPALARALDAVLRDPSRQADHARHNLNVMGGMTLAHTCASYLELFQPAAA